MTRHRRQHYVRRAPKMYGNLQQRPPRWSPFGLGRAMRRIMPFALLAAVLYTVMFSPLFKVKSVEIKGALLTDPKVLEEKVPRGMSTWLFPKDRVAADVQQEPSVADVRILRGLPDGIRIEVMERSPLAVWVTNRSTALVDERGIAFMTFANDAVPTSDTALGATLAGLPRIVDTTGLGAAKGDAVASVLFLAFVRDTSHVFAEILPTYGIDHFSVGATTYDVQVVTTNGLSVSLNSLGDAGVQVRNLARLANQGKLDGARAVDLRVDRWAYVR